MSDLQACALAIDTTHGLQPHTEHIKNSQQLKGRSDHCSVDQMVLLRCLL